MGKFFYAIIPPQCTRAHIEEDRRRYAFSCSQYGGKSDSDVYGVCVGGHHTHTHTHTQYGLLKKDSSRQLCGVAIQ